ncbi:sugar ABC transporter permease, partial [Mesorhizobium sp. M7A.F.Ca.CA.001.08.1.1]
MQGRECTALTQPADEMSKSERPNLLFRNLNA